MYIDTKQNKIHSGAFIVDVDYQIVSKSIQWFRRRRSSANKWKRRSSHLAFSAQRTRERIYIRTVTSAHRSANLESYAFLRSIITNTRFWGGCGNLSNHINYMNSMIFGKGDYRTNHIKHIKNMAITVTTVRIILNTSTVWTMVKMATTVTTVRIILNT